MIRFIKILFVVALAITTIPVSADKYKVLYTNSSKIKIADKLAVKGLVFEDRNQIQWTSNDQAIKVLNMTTNRISIIPAVVYKKNRAESLYDLLVKVNHMSTRGYGAVKIEADTICYLLDTLRIDAGVHYGKSISDLAILVMDGDTIITNLQKNNKNEFVLTRKIYGGKKAKPAYLDVVETDTDKDWIYYVYRKLRIEPLPLNADEEY